MSKTENKKPEPIRVGARFISPTGIWSVIRTWPGGNLEMFNKEKCMFRYEYTRDVRKWKRAGAGL